MEKKLVVRPVLRIEAVDTPSKETMLAPQLAPLRQNSGRRWTKDGVQPAAHTSPQTKATQTVYRASRTE